MIEIDFSKPVDKKIFWIGRDREYEIELVNNKFVFLKLKKEKDEPKEQR